MKKRVAIVTVFLINTMLLITSCKKTIDKPFFPPDNKASANKSNAKEGDKKVYVSTLDELYAAVNNPDNAATEVILSPGIYVLNSSYPNAGRLELQTDMSLKGQSGDADAVFIDQSSLPAASLVLTVGGRTG